MSVTPQDFLTSAIELSISGHDEIIQRNAISRAYYAAYHRACEFIRPVESDENVGVHKRYVNQLMKGENGSIERRIGGKIKSMFARRRVADYRITESIEGNAVAIQLSAAQELFNTIDSSEASPENEIVVNVDKSSNPRPSLKLIK